MTREVEARLKLSAVDRTSKAFNAIERRLTAVQQKTHAVNRVHAALDRANAGLLATSARVLAPAAVGLAAKNAIVTFAEVERRVGRIGMTAGASVEETVAVLDTVQKMAKEFALPLDDVMSAVEEIVASGKDLKETFEFLPSVLAAAQASGSATADIANTALKASSALKIEAKDMSRAFDIMVTSGKSGQFELKDMAAYIPGLANSFATLGYTGENGLKRLMAVLQTIREDTGSAESAATQAGEVFGKMLSSDTIAKFKKFGIDLPKQMQAAEASGEDLIDAFTRLSREAVKGDLKKLPQLFTDKDFRLAMTSLITSPEALRRYLAILNNADVDGTVWRDLQRVISDTEASIQRLSSSWDTMVTKFGASIAPVVTPFMDEISKQLDYQAAIQKALKDRGYSAIGAQLWHGSRDEADKLALEGGYSDPEFIKKHMQGPEKLEFYGPDRAEFFGGGHGYTTKNLPGSDAPVPTARPGAADAPDYSRVDLELEKAKEEERLYQLQEDEYQKRFTAFPGNVLQTGRDRFGMVDDARKAGEAAGDGVADTLGGAADSIGAKIGEGIAAAVKDAGAQIVDAIRRALPTTSVPRANADTGRSMPPSVGQPGGGNY